MNKPQFLLSTDAVPTNVSLLSENTDHSHKLAHLIGHQLPSLRDSIIASESCMTGPNSGGRDEQLIAYAIYTTLHIKKRSSFKSSCTRLSKCLSTQASGPAGFFSLGCRVTTHVTTCPSADIQSALQTGSISMVRLTTPFSYPFSSAAYAQVTGDKFLCQGQFDRSEEIFYSPEIPKNCNLQYPEVLEWLGNCVVYKV